MAQTPDQDCRVPTGHCRRRVLDCPDLKKGKQQLESQQNWRAHLNQMPPKLLGTELLAWKEDGGLFDLLLVSRRPGGKVRRCGFRPGPTAKFA